MASRSCSSAGIFILLPAFGARGLSTCSARRLLFHVAEGVARPRLFIGYLLRVGRIPDIRRVFQYHGAEHKAIAAYENDVELTPESAQQFTTAARALRHELPADGHGRHDRRVLVRRRARRSRSLIAVPARADPGDRGLAYEVIRFAAKHMDRRWVRVLDEARPRAAAADDARADLDQLEVAIASLRAVMTAEQLAEVDARAAAVTCAGRIGPPERVAGPGSRSAPCRPLTWTEHELLATDHVAEPLIAGGVRCHGGFDGDGRYLSPRTRYRVPAIDAWQQPHREQFGTELLDVPLSTWPETYPERRAGEVPARARASASRSITSLTRIGTVEGFGAMIRYAQRRRPAALLRRERRRHRARAPRPRAVRGARARRSRVGTTKPGTSRCGSRRATSRSSTRSPRTRPHDDARAHGHRAAAAARARPAEDPRGRWRSAASSPTSTSTLEMMIRRMISILLFIEISAFHTFAWAEAVLSDTDLVAGDGEAARARVATSAPDETPHVEYLQPRSPRCATARSSASRAASIAGHRGRSARSGTRGLDRVARRRAASRTCTLTLREVEHALDGNPRRDELLEEFHALGSIRPTTTDVRAASTDEDRHEVRHLLRAPAAASVGRGLRVQLLQDALEQCELADTLGIQYVLGGRAPLPRGVLALERARGVPRRGVAAHEAHPPRSRHRADAAAVQPSGPRRRAHRHARPRLGRPRRLRHRRVVVGGRARRLPHRPDREARDVGGGAARRGALHDRGAVHRPRRQVRHDAAPQRRARSRARSRTRRCGWRAAAATRSTSPRRRASARSAFAFVDPEEARHWVDDYYATLAARGRADRRRGQPEHRVRHDVHVPPRRGRGARARPRGRELLRLLARALLRVRPPPARRAPTCGPSTSSGGPSRATTRRRCTPRPRTTTGSAPRSSRTGVGGLRGAVGTPDQIREYLRRYEECGVDQVIFVLPGGQEPPRAHHGEPRAVRPRGAARVHASATRSAERDKAQRLAPVIDAGDGAQAGRGPPAAADRRLRLSRRSRARSPTGRAPTTSTSCSTSSPSRPRPATASSRTSSADPATSADDEEWWSTCGPCSFAEELASRR